ncbi:hypothetical protein CRG98_025832 [Punica granatum]|uniref:Uncharacterized protein n=1 Tax=Punica granatum TaxID=22663 RepID=A0A2I0JBZ7_PUNGR|nr:hypothetical protein CRG98_025832 [Punica granatum]
MGQVELPGHVRPRLTFPIQVVFHIDTTRSGTCRPAGWALGQRTGLGSRVLGRGGGAGQRKGTIGPDLAVRLDPGIPGRVPGDTGLVGSSRLDWTVPNWLNWLNQIDWVGPAQIEGKWAGPVRERTNGEDEDGRRGGLQRCGLQFPLLGTAAMA